MALHAYHDANDTLPPAAVWRTDQSQSLALHLARRVDRVSGENWVQHLLPHLGENGLAERFDPGAPVGGPANAAARTTPLPPMTCPADSFSRPK